MLEVFVIDSQAVSNVGCAFVRMGSLNEAEAAIANLHEQRVLIPEQRDLGPMQVAFAKGEAVRLGLDVKEETLPTFKEARQKVVEHNEKRQFFEGIQKRQEAYMKAMSKGPLPQKDLVELIKEGQRLAGRPFKEKWWHFCNQGWGGVFDYNPSKHCQDTLAHFVVLAFQEYGKEQWMQIRLHGMPPVPPAMGPPPPLRPSMMPPVPPGMPLAPGMPPPMMPPFGAPLGMAPPAMPPPMPQMPLIQEGGPWLPPEGLPAAPDRPPRGAARAAPAPPPAVPSRGSVLPGGGPGRNGRSR